MRNFWIYRQHDESGISGTGCVLEGVILHTGQAVVSWFSKTPGMEIFPSFADFKTIHIDSHPSNGTLIAWSDSEQPDISKAVDVNDADANVATRFVKENL